MTVPYCFTKIIKVHTKMLNISKKKVTIFIVTLISKKIADQNTLCIGIKGV